MSYLAADTAAQRPATGLDSGARHMMIKVVEELLVSRNVNRSTPDVIAGLYFRDRYGGLDDYLAAVASVWGDRIRFLLERSIGEAHAEAQFGFQLRPNAEAAVALALLTGMPEPDFRLAIEHALDSLDALDDAGTRITAICRHRGIPWRLGRHGFEWTGDQLIEHEIIQPALTMLNDRRFASGVRVEFEQARAELKIGTPPARKQALHEASCSVESAMKVVLSERRVGYARTDSAQRLFESLRDNGVVAADNESMLLAVPRARNKRAGHGAGPVAHDVGQVEAEAFVAEAASVIVFLGRLLP
jgi:hypothetical protein